VRVVRAEDPDHVHPRRRDLLVAAQPDVGLAGVDLVTDPARVARYREIRDIAWQNAVPFREFAAT